MGEHFDIDRVKAVPLPAICEKMGIEIKRGNKIPCPFHDEKTPSCHIREDSFRCFGCAAGGDVVKFVMKYQDIPFPEALRWIAENFGIAPSSREFLEPPKRRGRVESKPVTVSENERAHNGQLCSNLFTLPEYAPLFDYAKSRRWEPGTLRLLAAEGSLGSDPDGTRLAFCCPWGRKVRRDLGSSRSCRYEAGKGRDCVWRMDKIGPHHPYVHIFEGETDLIAAASALTGWRGMGMIAAPGASWVPSEYQARFIGAHRAVRLCFDDDTAGQNATRVVAEFFKRVKGCEVEAFDWGAAPGGAPDIAALREAVSKESFIKLLASNWKKT